MLRILDARKACAEEALARHAQSFDVADKLALYGEEFLGSLEIRSSDGLKIVMGCLTLRLLSGLEALCLLAVHGYYTEAMGQKRSLMEGLARLAALSKNPDLFDEYLMQDSLNRVKLLKDIIRFRRDWDPDIPREPPDAEILATIAEIHEKIDAYNENAPRKLRDINTFDWAAKGKVDPLFFGHYTIASQSLHHAPRDLERHLVRTGDDLTAISIGPESGDTDFLVLSSCKFVFVGLQWFAESLGIEVPEKINDLYKHYEQVFGELAEAAIGAG